MNILRSSVLLLCFLCLTLSLHAQVYCSNPISKTGFEELKKSVSSASFSDAQMKKAKTGTEVTCLNGAQIAEIMLVFDFDEDRLTYAMFAVKYITNLSELDKLTDAFEYESNMDELMEFVNNMK